MSRPRTIYGWHEVVPYHDAELVVWRECPPDSDGRCGECLLCRELEVYAECDNLCRQFALASDTKYGEQDLFEVADAIEQNARTRAFGGE